ncbi:hypothetical protein JRO89_XS01G0175700 [Xanthoceras sorbifolium]|uniref:CAAX prenyl protease 2/Lysostaphin resistance protein A-like domain-containing protein n=1 Tax=Xanthoceras sorbifolium TaxID=99658 RepID=A0ABQ8IJS2_9ROSI|nr:hypothetical protein JRO89_XS01G0175700 [Xanthoceras sorbifolium]
MILSRRPTVGLYTLHPHSQFSSKASLKCCCTKIDATQKPIKIVAVKVVDNPIVKEILLSNNISKAAFVLVDCIITPVLEEAICRGFLLTSLVSTMKWQHAVVISSAIFNAA